MVMGVGTGIALSQNLTFRDLADEQHVTAKILLVQHFTGEHGVGTILQIVQSIVAPCYTGKICKFIYFPTGLHPEMPDGFKGNILCQDTDIENTGLFNHFPREVSHLDRNGDFCGLVAYLETGVGNTAIVFVGPLSRKNKKTITQIPQSTRVLSRRYLLNESSAPAGPSEPCHGAVSYTHLRAHET